MSENKGGRPETVLIDKQIAQVEALAAYLTINDIASYFGICERTFYDIKNRQEEVFAAYQRGIAKALIRVGSKLMKFIDSDDLNATTLDATKFYLTHQAGWVKTQEMNVTTKDVTPQPMKAIVNFSKPPEIANLSADEIDKVLDES